MPNKFPAAQHPLVTGWVGRENPFAFDAKTLDWAAGAARFDTGPPLCFRLWSVKISRVSGHDAQAYRPIACSRCHSVLEKPFVSIAYCAISKLAGLANGFGKNSRQ